MSRDFFRPAAVGEPSVPSNLAFLDSLVGGRPTYQRIVDYLALLKPPMRTLVRANTHEGNVGEIDDLKQAVLARAKEAGTDLSFYAASLVDVSPADEADSPMAEYAYHGIEVALRPESRHVLVGKDHACVGQNLWIQTLRDFHVARHGSCHRYCQ